MVWGACGFGAPTGQTIRWQLELLLLPIFPGAFRAFSSTQDLSFSDLSPMRKLLFWLLFEKRCIWYSRKQAPSVSQVLLLPGGACAYLRHSCCLGSSLGCPTMSPVPILSTWGGVWSPLNFLQVKISAFGREMVLSFCKSWPNTLKEESLTLEKIFISLWVFAFFFP